jgi:hypothetical protein
MVIYDGKFMEDMGRIIYKWRFQGGKDIELNGGSFFSGIHGILW